MSITIFSEGIKRCFPWFNCFSQL